MEEGSFRGSQQPVEELGEEGVEYAPSEDNDISYQLGEKIRSQAQRLAKLEQYKMLCERRIVELAPDHPLPVVPEHLGQVYEDDRETELHQAYQKIARLEQQFSHSQAPVPLSEFHSFPPTAAALSPGQLQELYAALYGKAQSLIAEKEEVEESLRAEVLQTEEQRAYIEALKQALETKMEELGFRTGGVDAFVELSQARAQLRRTSPDASLQQQLSLKSRELSELQSQNAQLQSELSEVTAELHHREDQLLKLEEEKTALVDYVQERSDAEKLLEEEKRILEDAVTTEKEKNAKTTKQLEAALKQVRDASHSHQESQSDREAAQSRVVALEGQVQTLTEQLRTQAGKNQALQTNNSTLAGSLQETQGELDALRTNYAELEEEVKKCREAVLVANTKVREVNEMNRSLGSEVKVYEERIAGYDDLVEQLNKQIEERAETFHGKQESTLRENITLKQRVRELEADLTALREDFKLREKTLQAESAEAKSVIDTLQSQLAQERSMRESRLSRQPHESEPAKVLQAEVKRLSQTLAAAQRQVEELQQENAAIGEQLAQVEEERRTAANQLKDREKKLAETTAANEGLKSSLDSLQADLDRISSDTQAMAEEAFQARQRANDTAQHHSGELKTLRKVLAQCGNVIGVFAGNLRAVGDAATEYGAVLSEGFRETVARWGEWEDTDAEQTCESVLDWVRTSTEELEALLRRVIDLKADILSLSDNQRVYEERIRELDILEREVKSKESNLSRELDSLMDINQSLKRENELAYQRIESLTSDNVKSRREVQTLADDLARAKDQIALYSVDSMKWKQTGEEPPQKGMEEKVALLVREKKELEMMMARLQSAVPSNALQRVFLEMMKTRSELEVSQHEYLRLENLLLEKEAEMRLQTRAGDKQQAIALRREVEALRQQLSHSEAQVSAYKRQMTQLETELQDAERAEKRRFAMQEESERNVVLLQEQLFRRNKETASMREDPRVPADFSLDTNKDEILASPLSTESLESRLTKFGVRENRPRLTLQDKLSQAKAELSQFKRRPPLS